MSKKKTTDFGNAVSRRKLIQGAAAVALAAAAVPFAACTSNDDKKTKKILDGPPPNCVNSTTNHDKCSFPLLALFLTFTTNPQFVTDTTKYPDSMIATKLGVNISLVQAFRSVVTSPPTPGPAGCPPIGKTYDDVRRDFYATLARANGYTAPLCPATFDTLVAIAKLS